MDFDEDNGSAAEDAGLYKNDVITKIDGQTIRSADDLVDQVKYYKSGETLTITYQRLENGEYTEHTADVTLRDKPATEESSADSETEQDTQGGSNGGSRENEGQAGNQNGGASSDEELQELFGELFGGYRQ